MRSIVIAPANTGSDNNKRITVIIIAHTNKGIISHQRFLLLIFLNVVRKLIAPKIEAAPARCKEKIDNSIEAYLWAKNLDRGGYSVHPVPTPILTNDAKTNNIKEGGRSQKLILFIRGKAISGAPIMIGTNQFPKPPIIIGITIKKIIMKAWAVTILLYI